MSYKGEVIRSFPYSKYILYKDEMNGCFYGVSYTIWKLFKKHKFTKHFKTLEELERYMKSIGYKIRW
jgi:hypothetical protein